MCIRDRLEPEAGQIREVRHLRGEAQDWGVKVVDDPSDDTLWMVGHFNETTEVGGHTLTSSGGYDIYAWRTWNVWFH